MIPGPTEIEPDILNIGAEPLPYMRTSAFSERLRRVQRGLQYIFETSSPVVVQTSSGTGAMSAAVQNFIAPGDEVLVLNGGTFGARWVEIARCCGAVVHEIKIPFGQSPSLLQIRETLQNNTSISALFTTLNETSSGAWTDLSGIGEILLNFPHVLYVVDCVSGLLVEPMKMDTWGIDIAISASQKALALPPGLSFLAASIKAVKRAERLAVRPYYFDILIAMDNLHRGQTPYTPAVGIIAQLEKRLQKIMATGLPAYRQHYTQLTEQLRHGLATLGFYPVAKNPANCVTAINTGNYDAYQIVRKMAETYHIELAPSGGELRSKMFRVCNFGHITKNDISFFCHALRKTLQTI